MYLVGVFDLARRQWAAAERGVVGVDGNSCDNRKSDHEQVADGRQKQSPATEMKYAVMVSHNKNVWLAMK